MSDRDYETRVLEVQAELASDISEGDFQELIKDAVDTDGIIDEAYWAWCDGDTDGLGAVLAIHISNVLKERAERRVQSSDEAAKDLLDTINEINSNFMRDQ